jgi:hypothetical protein
LKFTTILLGFGLLAGTLGLSAQTRASPHESTTATIDGKLLTISYGRPYTKGRNVWSGDIAPYGKVWRTGADEATVLSIEADIMLGPLHVVKGSYALFTIPGEKEWTLILNKVPKQWGAFKYDEKMDYGRTTMKVKKLSSKVEQLTIFLEPTKENQGNLKISWDDVEASVPLTVH